MKNYIKKIFGLLPGADYDKLIRTASRFPRHKPYRFQFQGLDLNVSDFISVAWQLKEIFYEQQMKFNSLSANPVILDCGSNVGVSVIYFKKLFPSAVITAFEPDPVLVKCLKENIFSNKIKDVTVMEKAVWINDLGVSFGSDGADGGSVFLEQNKKTLPSVRLKDVLIENISLSCHATEIKSLTFKSSP